MTNKLFALVQELQEPIDSLYYIDNRAPTDIGTDKAGNLYKILKISGNSKLLNGNNLLRCNLIKSAVPVEVAKLLDAKDGEIKWKVLN